MDLGAFAALYSYNISPILGQCQGRALDPQRRLQVLQAISDARGILTLRHHDPSPSAGQRAFWMPLSVTSSPGVSGSAAAPEGEFAAHDLRQEPVDVSFALRGGAMWGLGYFQSNTATIPAGAIRAAFVGTAR